MSSPPSRTRPSSGCSNPAITRSVVVLPEPDGPSSVKNSPSPTASETPSTATTSPYDFRTSSTLTLAKCFLQDVEPALQPAAAVRERHEDPNLVPEDAKGGGHEPLLPPPAGD